MKKQAGDRSEDWNARVLRLGLSSGPMTDVPTHGLSVDGTDRTHQEEGLPPRRPLLQGSPKEQVGTPAAGDASLVPAEEEVAAGCGRHLTSEGSQSRRRDELFRGPCEAAEGPASGTWGRWWPVGVKAAPAQALSPPLPPFIPSLVHSVDQPGSRFPWIMWARLRYAGQRACSQGVVVLEKRWTVD